MAGMENTPPRKQRKLRATFTEEALPAPVPRHGKLPAGSANDAVKPSHDAPSSCSEVRGGINASCSEVAFAIKPSNEAPSSCSEVRGGINASCSEVAFAIKPSNEATSSCSEVSGGTIDSRSEVGSPKSEPGERQKYQKLAGEDKSWAEQLPLMERALFLKEVRRSRSRTPPFCRPGRTSLAKVPPAKCQSWLAHLGSDDVVPAAQVRSYDSPTPQPKHLELRLQLTDPPLPEPILVEDQSGTLVDSGDLTLFSTEKRDDPSAAFAFDFKAADRTFREVLPGQRRRYLQWQRSH